MLLVSSMEMHAGQASLCLRRFARAYVRAVRDVQTEERRRIAAEAERFVDGMIDHGGLENSLPEPWPSKESLRRH